MKREPLFTWYEKLSMYFVGLIVMAFIIVIGDVKAAREKNEKIQEMPRDTRTCETSRNP